MRSSHKNLHSRDEDLETEIENDTEDVDRTCRKEFGRRNVEETVTDVRAAIKHLPKHYFKRIATNTNVCLQNTHSGIKTIVGRIKRIKQMKVKERRKTKLIHKILIAIAILLGLAAAAGVAYVFINSLLDCYNPAPPAQTSGTSSDTP